MPHLVLNDFVELPNSSSPIFAQRNQLFEIVIKMKTHDFGFVAGQGVNDVESQVVKNYDVIIVAESDQNELIFVVETNLSNFRHELLGV